MVSSGIALGFSGTRKGMTPYQMRSFVDFLKEHEDTITSFHHGMCVGADTEAHDCVREFLPEVKIHGYPAFPLGDKRTLKYADVDVRHMGESGCLEPMDRNRQIVDTSDIMVVTPTFPETKRSGTWATFRYARAGRHNVVVLPAGTYVNPKGL